MNEHEKTMEKKIFKNRVYVFLEQKNVRERET